MKPYAGRPDMFRADWRLDNYLTGAECPDNRNIRKYHPTIPMAKRASLPLVGSWFLPIHSV